MLTINLSKDTTVLALENVRVFGSRLITLSGLDLLSHHLDDVHTPLTRAASRSRLHSYATRAYCSGLSSNCSLHFSEQNPPGSLGNLRDIGHHPGPNALACETGSPVSRGNLLDRAG